MITTTLRKLRRTPLASSPGETSRSLGLPALFALEASFLPGNSNLIPPLFGPKARTFEAVNRSKETPSRGRTPFHMQDGKFRPPRGLAGVGKFLHLGGGGPAYVYLTSEGSVTCISWVPDTGPGWDTNPDPGPAAGPA